MCVLCRLPDVAALWGVMPHPVPLYPCVWTLDPSSVLFIMRCVHWAAWAAQLPLHQLSLLPLRVKGLFLGSSFSTRNHISSPPLPHPPTHTTQDMNWEWSWHAPLLGLAHQTHAVFLCALSVSVGGIHRISEPRWRLLKLSTVSICSA